MSQRPPRPPSPFRSYTKSPLRNNSTKSPALSRSKSPSLSQPKFSLSPGKKTHKSVSFSPVMTSPLDSRPAKHQSSMLKKPRQSLMLPEDNQPWSEKSTAVRDSWQKAKGGSDSSDEEPLLSQVDVANQVHGECNVVCFSPPCGRRRSLRRSLRALASRWMQIAARTNACCHFRCKRDGTFCYETCNNCHCSCSRQLHLKQKLSHRHRNGYCWRHHFEKGRLLNLPPRCCFCPNL